jgi:hypothetical protein
MADTPMLSTPETKTYRTRNPRNLLFSRFCFLKCALPGRLASPGTSYTAGDPILLSASVVDSQTRRVLRNVAATVTATRPSGAMAMLQLRDNGAGKFTVYDYGTAQTGTHQYEVRVQGKHDCSGEEFVRLGTVSAYVALASKTATLVKAAISGPGADRKYEAVKL